MTLLSILNLDPKNRRGIKQFARKAGIPLDRLTFYDSSHILPTGQDLEMICRAAGVAPLELMLGLGRLDRRIISALQKHAGGIAELIGKDVKDFPRDGRALALRHETALGKLYQGDCLHLMREMASESIDLVFA